MAEMFKRNCETKINVREKATENNFKNYNFKISRTLYVFFVIIRVIYALDFGFVTSASVRINRILKITNIVQTIFYLIVLPILIFNDFPDVIKYWYSVYTIQYFINITFLILCDREKTVRQFLENLLLFDFELQSNISRSVDLVIIFYTAFFILFKLGLWIISCIYFDVVCQYSEIDHIFIFILASGLSLPLIVYFYLLYSVYVRVKNLKCRLENYDYNIVSGQFLYKFLYDCTEKAKDKIDYLFFLALLIKIPELLITVYYTISEINPSLNEVFRHISIYSYVLQNIVLMFLPAFLATIVNVEANNIKLLLHNRLLLERGEPHITDIRRFIDYIEARPFEFRLCNLIPLNSTLPLMVVNMYITYLIAIAQFSHVK